VFQRLVVGPSEDQPFFRGRLRIIAVELYDEYVVVQWRYVPLPDSDMGEEPAMRFLDVQQSISLADDSGTGYHAVSGNTSGHPEEIIGRKYFMPAVSEGARRLHISAGDVRFAVDVRE
jgi:hypothetical protein